MGTVGRVIGAVVLAVVLVLVSDGVMLADRPAELKMESSEILAELQVERPKTLEQRNVARAEVLDESIAEMLVEFERELQEGHPEQLQADGFFCLICYYTGQLCFLCD